MKRYFFVLAAMALLAGCTTEVLDKVQNDSDFVSSVTMTATDFVMDGDTRTNLDLTTSGLSFTWAESDIVGIFPNAGDQVKFPMTAGAGTKSANFDGGGWALRNNYSYAAYYPFSMDNYKNSYTALPITYLGQSQSANNSTAGMGAYDYMVATASMPESGSVAFNFQHIGSVLYLQLTTPDAATFTKLTLSADEAIFTTEATVNISNGTLTPTATSKEITLDMNNISVNAGGTLNAWMLIAPVDATGKTLTATLTTSESDTYTVDLAGKNFQTGKAYRLEGVVSVSEAQTTTYYFSVGTTEVTASNYTTANNATTTIPTSLEYTSSQRVRHYFLIPSNKTLSVIDKNAQASVPITEKTDHGISNHKLYYTNGAIAAGGTIIITLTPSEPQPITYYWYAGQTQPTSMTSNPTPDDTNFTVDKWHTLGTTTIAKTVTGGTSGQHWYAAVPTELNLKPTASDLTTPDTSWDIINTIIINNISYSVYDTNGTNARRAIYMAQI